VIEAPGPIRCATARSIATRGDTPRVAAPTADDKPHRHRDTAMTIFKLKFAI